jgi:hypothetical protein
MTNNFIPIFQEYVRAGRWDLEQLIDREGTLVITLLDDAGHRTKLSFDSYMTYRKLDEGDALLTLANMRKSGGTAKYFYLVEDSDFVVWFNKERCNQDTSQVLRHYVVAAINDVVDILALDPPSLELA